MMKMDRGHNDHARSKHDSYRKARLLTTSMMLLIPAILFIIYWGNFSNTKDWKVNIFVAGSGLIILGCLWVMLFELISRDSRIVNIMGFLLLFVGGIAYLVGAIGEARSYSKGQRVNYSNDVDYDRDQDNVIDIKDGIYWFGLHSLIALDAIVLSIDCLTNLFSSQYFRTINWTFPLMFSTWFAFGYWLAVHTDTWWEKVAVSGFGIVAISMIILFALTWSKNLLRTIGSVLCLIAFLGSILVWIYFCVLISKYVNNGHDACLLIGLPFLISSQSLYLLENCSFGHVKNPNSANPGVNRQDAAV